MVISYRPKTNQPTEYPNLLIPWADLPGLLYLNKTDNNIYGVGKAYNRRRFYYVFERFNISYYPLKLNRLQVVKNGGEDFVKVTSSGDVDECHYVTSQLTKYPNVSIGPMNDNLACYITSFPNVHQQIFSGDSLSLFANFSFSAILIYSLILLIVTLIVLTEKSYQQLSLRNNPIWYGIVSVCRQKLPVPVKKLSRLCLAMLIVSTFWLQIVSINKMDIYRRSVAKFDPVDNFDEMIEQKLIPVISDFSSCYSFTLNSRQNKNFAKYFDKHKLMINFNANQKTHQIIYLASQIVGLNKVAILWSNVQLAHDTPYICYDYPQLIKSTPQYTSKEAFNRRLNFILTSNSINPQTKRKLYRYTYAFMEMGLFENLQYYSVQRLIKTNRIPSLSCLLHKIHKIQTFFDSLNANYFRRFAIIAIFIILISILVFILELII